MATASNGALRVVSGADTTAQLAKEAQERALQNAPPPPQQATALAGFILDQYTLMRRHRDTVGAGWSERLISALRAFNGQYEPSQLAAIKQFGGSEVYARIIAMKCRGTSSLLRDVYLGADKSWSLVPDPNPDIPSEILHSISVLIHSELAGAAANGPPDSDPNSPTYGQPTPGKMPEPGAIRDRIAQLTEAARQAAKKKAASQAIIAEDKLQEFLNEGGFYHALAEFLVDLPLFPFACIKGPTVKLKNEVAWVTPKNPTLGSQGLGSQGLGGPKAQAVTKPKLVWARISPFDLYWTPGVSDIEDASVIERQRLTRSDLNDCLDLPGYNQEEVRAVLDEYGRGGLSDTWDQTDTERAVLESRENARFNQSGMIDCLEFQGNAQGRLLLEHGMDPSLIPDPMRDYFVEGWLIGRHVIKVQLSASPRKRHQYFITSFEKVPGTVLGNGLPDILSDVQDVCNATLRSLVNNCAMASGPQVTVNDDRLSDGEDGEQMYPWKRWHVKADPYGQNTEKAIEFFQPDMNAQQLMTVYSAWSELADEMSAIPKYMTGAQTGSVGRTASGLSMLMSNSAKILQTVASNIDRDVMEGILGGLYDMVMLTDVSGLLTGEEEIRVMGVAVAQQKETQRARQLEFLQVTANPIDMQIIGPKGRAEVLRPVADGLGLPGEKIVPTDDVLDAQQKTAAAAAAAQGVPGHAGVGGPQANPGANGAQGGQQSSPVTNNTGPTTNTVTPTIQGGPH